MSSKTTNFNLHKIDLTDAPPDITVLNQNWDKIDTRMANIVTYYIANKSADDLTDPLALIPLSSTLNAELYAILGGTYAYVETIFYSGATTTNRRMQVAYSYNSGYSQMAMRVYSSNGWLAWTKIVDENDLNGITPDLSGVVSKSGDTMNGNLVIQNATPEINLKDTSGSGGVRLYKNASTDIDYGTYLTDISNSDGTHDILVLNRDERVKGKLYLRSQTEDGSSSTTYEIYGEHNKTINLKTYSALSEIGLTTGSETISGIATNLPNNSILVIGITTNNASGIYPSNYGLLTVKRSSGTRIEFDFVTNAGASYHAFYSITSSGDSWSDWEETATLSNGVLPVSKGGTGTTDISSLATAMGAARIQTGSYKGTGKVGSSNKNSLTFNFVPKLVMINPNGGNPGSTTMFIWIYGNSRYTTNSAHDSGAKTYASLSGTTLTWYCDTTATNTSAHSTQYNNSSYTYYWVAIG